MPPQELLQPPVTGLSGAEPTHHPPAINRIMARQITVGAKKSATGSSLAQQELQTSLRAEVPPLRLFLVEDSRLYRERLAEHLALACRIDLVGWADREQDAIIALQRCAWDVLIVDLQLKQGTGLGVLRALRGARRQPDSRIIMLTEHDFYLYRRKAAEFGADLYFVKGNDFQQLARVVKDVSERRSASARI